MVAHKYLASLSNRGGIDDLIAAGVPLHRIEQWLDDREIEQAAHRDRKPSKDIRSTGSTIKGHPADVTAGRYDVAW